MTVTAKQYQSLQSEACRLAEDLPKAQFLASLIATYEAGRLLHLTRPTLIGLLGSVALRRILDEVDEELALAPPEPGLWPRVVQKAEYDETGNLVLTGTDDNDHPWHESVTGCDQAGWLLKQLYVERRFGRRRKPYSAKKRRPH
jgi:hypothetical protein